MVYVDQDELRFFIFEVCQGFLAYCTKHPLEFEIDAPTYDELKVGHLLNLRRLFTEDEMIQIIEIMEIPYTVERFNKIYSSSDFLDVLSHVIGLIEQFSELTAKEIKKEYQEILHKYALMDVDIRFSQKIHTRIRGVRGAHKRYSNVLYKKHQVIYDFMLNKAKEQGKWKNLNTAVDSVLPELDMVLKQFDKEWISIKLAEKTKEFEKLKQEFEAYKANPPRYKLGSAETITTTRHQTYIHKIRAVRMECNELDKALHMDDPSLLLKKQLPFNTAYQPEVIKNLLRKETDLLAEILIKQQEC